MKHLPDVLSWKYPVSELFAFHNEHRIVTSKLIFIADAFLFSSAGFFPAILLTLLLIAMGSLMGWMSSARASDRVCTIAAVVSLLLSIAHSDNFSSGFQVQFPLVDLLAVVAIGCMCLGGPDGPRSIVPLAATVAADLLAVLSMASGNILVVPLLMVGILLRLRVWKLAAVGMAAVVISGFYFVGYPEPDVPHRYAPLGVAHFAIAYLGSALRGYPHAPTVLGAALLTAYLAVMLRLAHGWLRRAGCDPVVAWLAGVATFVVLGALVTATGRLSLGLEAAVVSRYALQSVLFASCLFLIGWRTLHRRGFGDAAKLGLAGLALALAATSTLASLPLREWRARVADYDIAGFAFASGVISDQATRGIYPRHELIASTLEFMGQHRLGPFSATYAEVFRPPVNAVALEDLDRLAPCTGALDGWAPIGPDQVWARGWIVAAGVPAQDGWVLAFGPGRRLLGAARQSVFRPDAAAALGIAARRIGYEMGLDLAGAPAQDRSPVTLVLISERSAAPVCRSVIHPT